MMRILKSQGLIKRTSFSVPSKFSSISIQSDNKDINNILTALPDETESNKYKKDLKGLIEFRNTLENERNIPVLWSTNIELFEKIQLTLYEISIKDFPSAKHMDGQWIAQSFRDPVNLKTPKADVFNLSHYATDIYGKVERENPKRAWNCKGYAKGDVVLLMSNEIGTTSSSSINCGLLHKCPGRDEYKGYYMRLNSDTDVPKIETIEIQSFKRNPDCKVESFGSSPQKEEHEEVSFDEIAIVIPAFNEIRNLPFLLKQIKGLNIPDSAVFVVDDNSTDDTYTYCKNNSECNCIKMVKHSGASACILKGIEMAKNNSKKYIITMDADGQHDPSFLPKFAEEVHNGRFVCGNRFRSPQSVPSQKLSSNAFASKLAKHFFDVEMADISCGYRAFPIDIFDSNFYQRQFDGFTFIYSSLFDVLKRGKEPVIVDVPVIYDKSKLWCTPVDEMLSLVRTIHEYCKKGFEKELEAMIKNISEKNTFLANLDGLKFQLFPIVYKSDKNSENLYFYLIESDTMETYEFFRHF